MSVPGKRSGAIDTLREWLRRSVIPSPTDHSPIFSDATEALDDVVALLEAAKEMLQGGAESRDNPLNWIGSSSDADDLAAAARQVEGT